MGFREGWLYVWHNGRLVRVHGWPGLETEERVTTGTWESRGVELRDTIYEEIGYLRPPAPTDFFFADGAWWDLADGQRYFAWAVDKRERRRAWGQYIWERFDALVPVGVRARIALFPCDWWSSLMLAKSAPALLDLGVHDPLLAVALARHWEFPAVGREDWEGVRRHAGWRRRDWLAWLGFPAGEGAINALRKHRLLNWEHTRAGRQVREFLEVMQDDMLRPELRRLEQTNSDLILALLNPTTRLCLKADLLRDILRTNRNKIFAAVVEINDIRAMADCGLTEPSPALLREYRRRGQRGRDWLLDSLKDLPFPNWPSPMTTGIEPLMSVHELIREGREMKHCIGGFNYVDAALKGHFAAYRVTAPVRATLALHRDPLGWLAGDLKGRANAEISPEHRAQILRAFSTVVAR